MRSPTSLASIGALVLALAETGSATPAKDVFANLLALRAEDVCPADACKADVNAKKYTWTRVPASQTSTFTAFTVVTVINTVLSTTKTSTIWAKVPAGFIAPVTDSVGRRVEEVSYFDDAASMWKTTQVYVPSRCLPQDKKPASPTDATTAPSQRSIIIGIPITMLPEHSP
jgi:hypothetical protein